MQQHQRRVVAGFTILAIVLLLVWWGISSAPEPEPPADVLNSGDQAVERPATAPTPFEGMLEPLVAESAGEDPPAPGFRDDDHLAHTGRLIVRVTWGEDGSPASGTHLKLVSWDGPDPLFRVVRGVTDADGEWVHDRAHPGMVTAYGDRGGAVTGEVVIGKTTKLLLEIPEGTTILGLVLDPQERPVGGADVWLSGYGNTTTGQVVGHADDAGRFVLRAVTSFVSVGARAPGFTPSPLRTVRDDVGAELSVTLKLGPQGGTVRGLVLDGDDEPVVGANVLLGPPRGWPAPDPRNRLDWSGPPPYRTATDGEGIFVVEGVPPGPIPLRVRADGASPWKGSVHVIAGEWTETIVEVQPAAVVFGVVADGNNRPVAGASLSSGRYGEMDGVSTLSNAGGEYELAGLATGSPKLLAVMDGVGKVEEMLHVRPGDRVEWNPVLTLGRQIRGLLVNESGAPVADFVVQARKQHRQDGWREHALTDSVGRFVISNCEDVEHVLTAWPQGIGNMAVASLDGIRPGDDDVTFVISDDTRYSASVTGRVVDSRGEPVPDAIAALFNPVTGSGPIDRTAADSGGFSIGPVAPGQYFLSVQAPGFPVLRSDLLDLTPDEVRDMGTIQLQEPGFLEARLIVPVGVPANEVYGNVRQGGAWITGRMTRRDDGRYVSEPLHAGEYELSVGGRFVVTALHPFRVESGATTSLDVAVERGVYHSMEFTMPFTEDPAPELYVTLHDDRGALAAESTLKVRDREAQLIRRSYWQVCVRPGVYTMRASLDGVLQIETNLNIADTGTQVTRSEYVLD